LLWLAATKFLGSQSPESLGVFAESAIELRKYCFQLGVIGAYSFGAQIADAIV
jgi:hypothetical protein